MKILGAPCNSLAYSRSHRHLVRGGVERFWAHRVEDTDVELTTNVALILDGVAQSTVDSSQWDFYVFCTIIQIYIILVEFALIISALCPLK